MQIYPDNVQQSALLQNFGCCRWLWNQMLGMQYSRKNAGSYIVSTYAMNNLLPQLKREYPWLAKAESSSLQMVNGTLHTAFSRWHNGVSRKPRFKRRKSEQSFTVRYTNGNISVQDAHHIKLPKLGTVYFRAGRIPHGKIISATLRMKPDGRYFASVLCEDDEPELPKTGRSVGIDLGLDDYAVLSTGEKIPMPDFYAMSSDRLKHWQRLESRRLLKAKAVMAKNPSLTLQDFANYQTARREAARIMDHIACRRYDFLQKLSTRIVKEFDLIHIENLNIAGMLKNHHLAKHIADSAWGMFAVMLKQKAAMYGKTVEVVNPAYTSQKCSVCGALNNRMGLGPYQWLKVREWTCPHCGAHHDRDVNASINILMAPALT